MKKIFAFLITTFTLSCLNINAQFVATDFGGQEDFEPGPSTDEKTRIGLEELLEALSLELTGDYIGRAKAKRCGHNHHIEYSEAEADFSIVYYYNKCHKEAANISFAINRTRLHFSNNPFFNENEFNTASIKLGFYSKRLCRWRWEGQIAINFDVNHWDFESYTNYDFILWGRYDLWDDFRLHIGFLGQTGMKIDRVYPIIGFDWKYNYKWRFNFVFPVNLSAVYIYDDRLSFQLAGRLFTNRYRLSSHSHLSKGLWTYTAAGAELATVYRIDQRFNVNLHAGYMLGGLFKIANRHYRDRRRYRFDSAPYAGAQNELKKKEAKAKEKEKHALYLGQYINELDKLKRFIAQLEKEKSRLLKEKEIDEIEIYFIEESLEMIINLTTSIDLKKLKELNSKLGKRHKGEDTTTLTSPNVSLEKQAVLLSNLLEKLKTISTKEDSTLLVKKSEEALAAENSNLRQIAIDELSKIIKKNEQELRKELLGKYLKQERNNIYVVKNEAAAKTLLHGDNKNEQHLNPFDLSYIQKETQEIKDKIVFYPDPLRDNIIVSKKQSKAKPDDIASLDLDAEDNYSKVEHFDLDIHNFDKAYQDAGLPKIKFQNTTYRGLLANFQEYKKEKQEKFFRSEKFRSQIFSRLKNKEEEGIYVVGNKEQADKLFKDNAEAVFVFYPGKEPHKIVLQTISKEQEIDIYQFEHEIKDFGLYLPKREKREKRT